jgi:hypothetical protein
MRDEALVPRQGGLRHQDLRAGRARPLERSVDARRGSEVGHRPLAGRLVAFAVHQAAADAVLGVREQRDPERPEALLLELAVEQFLVEGGRALEIRDRDFTPDDCVLHFALLHVRDCTPQRMISPC